MRLALGPTNAQVGDGLDVRPKIEASKFGSNQFLAGGGVAMGNKKVA